MKETKDNREEWVGNDPIIEFLRKTDDGYFPLIWHYLVTFIDSIEPMGVINIEHHILF